MVCSLNVVWCGVLWCENAVVGGLMWYGVVGWWGVGWAIHGCFLFRRAARLHRTAWYIFLQECPEPSCTSRLSGLQQASEHTLRMRDEHAHKQPSRRMGLTEDDGGSALWVMANGATLRDHLPRKKGWQRANSPANTTGIYLSDINLLGGMGGTGTVSRCEACEQKWIVRGTEGRASEAGQSEAKQTRQKKNARNAGFRHTHAHTHTLCEGNK